MKITKEYLRKVIKESLEEIKDEEGMDFGDEMPAAKSSAPEKKKYAAIRVVNDVDRGGNAVGFEYVRADKWSKTFGRNVKSYASELMRKHFKTPEKVLQAIKTHAKRNIEGKARNDAWAIYSLDVDKFMEGFMEGAQESLRYGLPGSKTVYKIVLSNKDKIKSMIEKIKASTLSMYPDASKPPKRVGVVGSDPGRGMSTPIYGDLKKRVDEPDDEDTGGEEDEDDLE